MTDDAAWLLVQHVCRTRYADLPESAARSARRDVLDTFGCMLGGSGSPGIDELCRVMGRWGGLEESRVLLRATRLPAPQAALLNASMGHALDFDDTLDTGGSIHPGVSVLAACWRGPIASGASAGGMSCWQWRSGWTYRAASRWPVLGSRLAPYCCDGRIWCHGGGGQTDGSVGGPDAARLRYCLQSRRRQPSVHPGWGTDQAHAGRTGGERRCVLRRFGANRVHWGA